MAKNKAIGVGGKGGTGKTTVCALMVRLLVEGGHGSVLAVDADANANLNELLGIEVERTIADVREGLLAELSSLPLAVFKDNYFEYKLYEAIVEADGFDLLVMGRPEGYTCYCYANNVLRKYLQVLMSNYKYIIIDNEAGLEHLSRQRCYGIDKFFIITDRQHAALRSAIRIKGLIEQLSLQIKEVHFILNRGDGESGQLDCGLNFSAIIPYDEAVEKLQIRGEDIFRLQNDAISIKAVREILEQWVIF